jgi:hypothetical protein
MRTDRRKRGREIVGALAGIGLVVALCATEAAGQPASPHHGFLGGPWEVLATMGHDGAALRLPLSIADENKPQKLQAVLPVMGTPVKVKLERYLPQVDWETAAVDDPNGGPAARLSLQGEGLQQKIWLCARDRERQSVSAHIGSVAIRELPPRVDPQILQELTDPEVTGVLLVWLPETAVRSPGQNPTVREASPLVYTVRPGKVVTLAGSGWPTQNSASGPSSPWKLTMLRYVPHYSIDRQTKEVTSLSDHPENPALQIRVEGNGQTYEQWLWSLFAASPHAKQPLPFRARFVDFHLEGGSGRYILVTSPGMPSYLLGRKDGKKTIEPVAPGQRYSFEDPRYSFGVDEIRFGARVVTTWKEGSEVLLNPAIVATILQSTSAEQVLLELGKPYHYRTPSGTLVVLYRRVPDNSPQPQS